MTGLKHRPEVDGLRAVAVVPVVLFHAGFGFRGGYVGVDVFFVISGFLITSLILKDGEHFSIVSFWERRIRRIVPAVAVVVTACLIAGWFLLFPRDFEKLGRSVAAQAALMANVFFWRDSAYFEANQVRPLLHTWSLAVEEQFYLLFPFSLMALRRFSRRTTFWVIASLALLSLIASVHGLSTRPTATFYLLPTRAWELLLGAMLATGPTLSLGSKWLTESLSAAGLVALLGAAWFYTEKTPFPGATALLPCLGTAAIIGTNSRGLTAVGRVLSRRPFVFIGLLSYSLYLWHWPMLSFAHYRVQVLSSLGAGLVLAASLLLAYLSWRYVEAPIRKRLVWANRRAVFAAAGVTMSVLLSAGLLIARAQGVESRFGPDVLGYLAGRADNDFRVEVGLEAIKRENLIELGQRGGERPIDLLVWGDSHAMAVLHVIDIACREHGVRCLAATHSATAPLLDFPGDGPFSLGPDAIPYNRAVVDFVANHRVKSVLLVASWAAYGRDEPDKFPRCLAATVYALQATGTRVVVMKDVPRPGFDVPSALATAAAAGNGLSDFRISLAAHLARNRSVNGLFDSLAVMTLDPAQSLCEKTGFCPVERGGHVFYFDDHHLSTYGSMQVRPTFEALFATSAPGL